jgi:hypothetical protein
MIAIKFQHLFVPKETSRRKSSGSFRACVLVFVSMFPLDKVDSKITSSLQRDFTGIEPEMAGLLKPCLCQVRSKPYLKPQGLGGVMVPHFLHFNQISNLTLDFWDFCRLWIISDLTAPL